MKLTFILTLILYFSTLSLSQTDWKKYESIVNKNSLNAKELSLLITKDFKTEKEKVEAIYYWITKNIRYDYRLYRRYKKRESKKKRKKYTKKKLAKKEKREIEKTLRKRKGVCHQYSLLFKALCDFAKIECEYISGWAKADPIAIARLGESHAWNAVRFDDGDWAMIDATFGSGFLDLENKFHFAFNENYFDTYSEGFAMNHHPRKKVWQLNDSLASKTKYKNYPTIGNAYLRFGIDNLNSVKRRVQTNSGEIFEFTFTSKKEIIDKEYYCINFSKDIFSEKYDVDIKIEKKEDHYLVKINSGKSGSGKYAIIIDGDLLFSFRMKVLKK